MSQHYSDPARALEPHALPDVEVFYWSAKDLAAMPDTEGLAPGWYYWFCFPGCLPESASYGPYETEQDAITAAQESVE